MACFTFYRVIIVATDICLAYLTAGDVKQVRRDTEIIANLYDFLFVCKQIVPNVCCFVPDVGFKGFQIAEVSFKLRDHWQWRRQRSSATVPSGVKFSWGR